MKETEDSASLLSSKESPGKPSKTRNGNPSGYESNEGDNIKVYVRVRPPAKNLESGVDRSQCIEVTSANTLVLQSKPDPKTFSFDHVADVDTMQEEVFGAVGKKIVEGCVNGYNGTIFAYGQTGSGKTFTMLGPAEGDIECFTHELRGVIPRGFEYLFSLIKREQEKHGDHLEFLCRCSFLEIYNEQIFDLLDPASSGLALREDLKKGIFVDGLLDRDVASAKDAYTVLHSGWLNRRVASTSMNRESSRSHAVFTVTLESKEKKGSMCNIKVSKLHLVDLAGSERQRDTHAEGLRLKEASSINKSLSALGNVIMALVDITHGKQRHVHYRDSKLTFLLRDSLGGNARTYIIANVHPSAKCFGETLSTLNFARRAKMIKNKAVINEDSTGSVIALQAEIRKLREELTNARSGMQKQVTRQVPTEPDNDAARDQSCSDTNNNSGNDYGQQYKEWRQMIIAATEGRDRAEQEKQALVEKVQKLEELCNKKDRFVQSTKMILKFRESHIVKLERMRKGNQDDQERDEDSRDKQIHLLKEEISILKEKIEHHPDVTRFAMENLELRAEVKKLRQFDEDGNDVTHELAKCHRYTLQLERQLRDLLQSPQGSVDLERSLSSSLLNLEASNAELEKFKVERGQLNSQLETTREDLQQARDSLQQTKEKLVNEGETYRKKILDLDSELSSFKKANNELEKALETFQLKTAVERTTLNDIHMQTIKTLTSPRKSFTPNRLAPHSAASTPKRGDRGKKSLSKLVNSPVINLADEKPPNGLFRRDSFHDTGSDSEFDEPFFNFDDDPNDAEELYADALTDELKKLQDVNNVLLQQKQGLESNMIKLNQSANKQEHLVLQLNNILSSEREKHAAIETVLNMKNLSLTDRLKEAKRELTVFTSEVEDLKIVLQSADKELETIKKQRDLESIETGRTLASLESKLTHLEIENFNQQNEIENGIESVQNLQSEVETLQDELQFNNHKIDEYETMLQSERQRTRELEQELQTTNEKLHFQTETNVNLMAEQDKQELARALDQCQTLQLDLQRCNAECEAEANKVAALEKELEKNKEVIASLDKRNDSDKGCVNNLMASVVGLKKVVSEKQNDLGILHTELEESRSQQQELSHTIQEKQRKIDKLRDKLEKEIEKAAKERIQRDSEISLTKEDLKRTAQQCKDLTEALEQQQQQITTMQTDLKNKVDQISHLEAKHTGLVSDYHVMESKYEARIAEQQQRAGSHDGSFVVIEAQFSELEQYKITQVKLTRAIEGLEVSRQEKNEELAELRQTLEQIKYENEMLETKNKTLSYKLEAEIEGNTARNSNHNQELTRLRTAVEESIQTKDQINQQLEKLYEEHREVESKLEMAIFNKTVAEENADGMVEELERTQMSEAQIFAEKEELNSKCEKLMEEKLKLDKTAKKLGEENAKLTGHQNQQQKIQYLLALKRENNDLQKEIRRLKDKCRCVFEPVPAVS